MTKAELNNDMIATKAGDIIVFNYDGATREYLSSSVEYLAVGVGLPANTCIVAPGDRKDNYVICRTDDFTVWEYVADHRGETVYSTETGEAVIISILGDYPKNTTRQPPVTPFDKWNGSEWITDTEAQHAADITSAEHRKTTLLAKARISISLWQTELQLGVISDDDKASLINWLAYIKTLQAVDIETVPAIIWPEIPVL